LQPLTRIHLHSHRDHEIESVGSVARIYLFMGIGVLIFLAGTINFDSTEKR